ncbi:hypothetical protein J6524_12680 [Bradyrhizobium sp. WSM 1738]|uniref:hypothetical protein n=1 Tax=Bradyrhizobium hereditatis TaxID=2821405 RepID=UPI001CE31FFB|nr:hypothetical protein [Bradyrhizobium hereditatis]MCA6115741.1 hypothetical protein [Bradyrhizobium hereditatis]
MCAPRLFTGFILALIPTLAVAANTEWRRYVVPSTGTSVDMPVSIFTSDGGAPEGGTGRRFFTEDRRADMTVQSIPNPGNDSPAIFLTKMRPPDGIIYKRVTSDFFVVSSIRDDRIWYNRCNRGNGAMNCVLINYPAAEKRHWDGVVTRISRTLRS